MSTLVTGTADHTDRIRALIGAHRHVQAEHRAALAAESRPALTAAEQRSHLITEALRRCGAAEVAARLAGEAQAGSGLIVALTSDDTAPTEVEDAIVAYLRHRQAVDTAATGERQAPG